MSKVKNPLNDDHYDGNDDQIDDLKDAVWALQGTITQMSQTATGLLDKLAASSSQYPGSRLATAARKLREEVKQAAEDSAKYPDPRDGDDPWETGELGRDEAHVRRATPEQEAALRRVLDAG